MTIEIQNEINKILKKKNKLFNSFMEKLQSNDIESALPDLSLEVGTTLELEHLIQKLKQKEEKVNDKTKEDTQ